MDPFANALGNYRGKVNPARRAHTVRAKFVRGSDLLATRPKTDFQKTDAQLAEMSVCPCCERRGLDTEHYYDRRVRRLTVTAWMVSLVAVIIALHLAAMAGPVMLTIPIWAVAWHAVGCELGRRTLVVCPDCDWAEAHVNHSGLGKFDVVPETAQEA